MIHRLRIVVVVLTSLAIVGAGVASMVGQVRQRRRPRATHASSLPAETPSIDWAALGLRLIPHRRPDAD